MYYLKCIACSYVLYCNVCHVFVSLDVPVFVHK